MKLSKLYSDDLRFKSVVFSSGFNIVLGKITDVSNIDKDCHNLGKTTLIDLIDYMLLKDLKKSHFLKQKEFKSHTFYLEIELNSKKYLTIKRNVSKNTKISFKLSDTRNNDFSHEFNWDYENLPLKSKDPNTNPKMILNNLLGYNVLSQYKYRDFLNYFLRTQNDYADEFHLSKYSGSDSNWKPQLFDLLGFDAYPLKEKYKLDSDYSNQKEYISKLKKENHIDVTEIDKLNGLIQIKESEKKEIEESLSKVNFYLNEKNIDKNLVDNIENKISKLNSKRYNLNLELKSLEQSIQHNFSFDMDSTLKIFNEVKIYFSDQLKKSYNELLEFNKTITNDRNKYIKTTIKTKSQQLKEIEEELIKLNKNKSDLLDVLIESDIFKKYKVFERNLINVEKDLESLTLKLKSLSIIDNEETVLKDIKDKIDEIKKLIKQEIEDTNSLYSKIRKSFTEFVKYVIDKSGLISIIINTSGNIDFKSEILSDDNEVTSQGKGHTYKKILCACFDLAILVNYSDKSFFKFIYHDGVLESLDPRKQVKYLNLVSNICVKYDIQYILTAIESDIPIENDQNKNDSFFINPHHIAVRISDLDETTNLFGFTF